MSDILFAEEKKVIAQMALLQADVTYNTYFGPDSTEVPDVRAVTSTLKFLGDYFGNGGQLTDHVQDICVGVVCSYKNSNNAYRKARRMLPVPVAEKLGLSV